MVSFTLSTMYSEIPRQTKLATPPQKWLSPFASGEWGREWGSVGEGVVRGVVRGVEPEAQFKCRHGDQHQLPINCRKAACHENWKLAQRRRHRGRERGCPARFPLIGILPCPSHSLTHSLSPGKRDALLPLSCHGVYGRKCFSPASVHFFPPALSESFCNQWTFDLLRCRGELCCVLYGWGAWQL